jgi:agmatinase
MLRNWPENTFVETPPAHAGAQKSAYVILPIAYEGTACYGKGTRQGPDAIIEASTQIEDYDEKLGQVYWKRGIHLAGHVLGEEEISPEAVQQRVYAAAAAWVARGKIVIALGGEHSVTPALVRATRQTHPGMGVLHFDAHADLRDQYHDTPWSHACVMRRLLEMDVPFVSVGIRSISEPEAQLAREHGLELIDPETVTADPQAVAQRVCERLTGPVYVSFDIDGLDPAVAPGTGTPEPGGLTYREALAVLEGVLRRRQLAGADMVEVAPIPGNHVTEVVAARLVAKMIAFSSLR